jgi:hypothetical protein
MPYQTLTILPSAARTTSGSAAVGVDDLGNDYVSVQVSVTAVSGTTPTLDISLEWSMDGTIWSQAATPDTFAQITANTSVVKAFQTKGLSYRVVWTIGGTTPSFTFSVRSYEAR